MDGTQSMTLTRGMHRARRWSGRLPRGAGIAVPSLCALVAVTAAGYALAHPGGPMAGPDPAVPPVTQPETGPTSTAAAPSPPPAPLPATPVGPRARVPFGSHRYGYVAGTLRVSGKRATVDAQVLAYYRQWRTAFVRTDCGHPHVISPDADHPMVAEAQGYGLVITALMAGGDAEAKDLFDGILGYVLAHPSSVDAGLHAAEQDAACRDVNGADSATDGDLDIAYGLLLADRQWGSRGRYDYRKLALRRIAAIARSEVDPKTHLMRLGDWSTDGDALAHTSRTSDWLPDHLRAFRRATGNPIWDTVLRAHRTAISGLRNDTGLLPDFVVNTNADLAPAAGKVLETDNDGAYSWNACRVPLRLGADAATSGDRVSVAASRAVTAWARSVTGGDPARFSPGYTLDGTPLDAGEEAHPAFVAPLAVAAMQDPSAQPWLDALWRWLSAQPVEEGHYYASSVQLLSMLVVSGNYWVP